MVGRPISDTRMGTHGLTKSYPVDGMGNRTAQTVGAASTSFSLNCDDGLTSTSGWFVNSCADNADGEQTGRTLAGTAYTLAFDYDGQLTSVTPGAHR